MKKYKITYNVEEVDSEVKFQAIFIAEGKDKISAGVGKIKYGRHFV